MYIDIFFPPMFFFGFIETGHKASSISGLQPYVIPQEYTLGLLRVFDELANNLPFSTPSILTNFCLLKRSWVFQGSLLAT